MAILYHGKGDDIVEKNEQITKRGSLCLGLAPLCLCFSRLIITSSFWSPNQRIPPHVEQLFVKVGLFQENLQLSSALSPSCWELVKNLWFFTFLSGFWREPWGWLQGRAPTPPSPPQYPLVLPLSPKRCNDLCEIFQIHHKLWQHYNDLCETLILTTWRKLSLQ